MSSNFGAPPPPPPPPRRPNGASNDVGSLSAQYAHQQMKMHQPPMHQPMAHHHAAPQGGGYYSPPQNAHPQYQYQQYYQQQPQYQQMQQPQYYNQYSQNRGYANHAIIPPPPPQPMQHHNNRNSNNNHARGKNGRTNADVAASLRQSFPTDAFQKPKKINPKMAKKYAGRGLKTITVSGPGLPPQRFKICVGNHPDDVKKWIEERKKRFPRSGGRNGEGNDDVSGKKRAREGGEEWERTPQKRACVDVKSKGGDTTNNEGEAQAKGLSSLLAGYDSSSSEGEVRDPKAAASVGQSRKESQSTELQSPVGDSAQSPEQPPPKRLCRYHQRGKCRHGSSCKFLHSDATSPKAQQNRRETQSERDRARNRKERELRALGLAAPSHGSRHSSGGKVIDSTSLLHRLLQRDKEREHRLTLQLLRYIVDCDYFRGEAPGKSCMGEAKEPE